MDNLPSLSALRAFLCAAEHLNFTAAAEQLARSQPAVSHAVKLLEGQLGVALFERQQRKLILTAAGEKFAQDVHLGLDHIERSVQALRNHVANDRRVTLSTSTAFATHWLLPRVAQFKALHSEVDLRFQTTAYDIDLYKAGIALAIRHGRGDWPDMRSWRMFDEKVLAVCSPAYLNGRVLEDPSELQQHTLIHLDEPHRTRMDWHKWFSHLGLTVHLSPRDLQLNDYTTVLQTAIEGQGIALGWHYIVERLLANGQLVPACQQTVVTDYGFYLIAPANLPLTAQAETVRDWMLAHGQDGVLASS